MTKLSATLQRRVASAVKTARAMAIIPFTSKLRQARVSRPTFGSRGRPTQQQQ